MPRIQNLTAPQQLELPDTGVLCQRWRDRVHSFRRTSEGGFDPARYRVRALPAAAARAFVTAHHYSATWPAVRMSFALIDTAAPGPYGGGSLPESSRSACPCMPEC